MHVIHDSFEQAGFRGAVHRLLKRLCKDDHKLANDIPWWLWNDTFLDAVQRCKQACRAHEHQTLALLLRSAIKAFGTKRQQKKQQQHGEGNDECDREDDDTPSRCDGNDGSGNGSSSCDAYVLAATLRLLFGELMETVAAVYSLGICAANSLPTGPECTTRQQSSTSSSSSCCSSVSDRHEFAWLSYDAYIVSVWTSAHAEYIATVHDMAEEGDAEVLQLPCPELLTLPCASNALNLIALHERMFASKRCSKTAQTFMSILSRAMNPGSRGWQSALHDAIKDSEGPARVFKHLISASLTGLHPCLHPAARRHWSKRAVIARTWQALGQSTIKELVRCSPKAIKIAMKLHLASMFTEDAASLEAFAASQSILGTLGVPPFRPAEPSFQKHMHAFAAAGAQLFDFFSASISASEAEGAHLKQTKQQQQQMKHQQQQKKHQPQQQQSSQEEQLHRKVVNTIVELLENETLTGTLRKNHTTPRNSTAKTCAISSKKTAVAQNTPRNRKGGSKPTTNKAVQDDKNDNPNDSRSNGTTVDDAFLFESTSISNKRQSSFPVYIVPHQYEQEEHQQHQKLPQKLRQEHHLQCSGAKYQPRSHSSSLRVTLDPRANNNDKANTNPNTNASASVVTIAFLLLSSAFRSEYVALWAQSIKHGTRASRLDKSQFETLHGQNPIHCMCKLISKKECLRLLRLAIKMPESSLLSIPQTIALLQLGQETNKDRHGTHNNDSTRIPSVEEDAPKEDAPEEDAESLRQTKKAKKTVGTTQRLDDDDKHERAKGFENERLGKDEGDGDGDNFLNSKSFRPTMSRAAKDSEAAVLNLNAYDAAKLFFFAKAAATNASLLSYDLGRTTRTKQLRALARRLCISGAEEMTDTLLEGLIPKHGTHLYFCKECKRISNALQDDTGKDLPFNEIGLSASMLNIQSDEENGVIKCAKRSSAALRTSTLLEKQMTDANIECMPCVDQFPKSLSSVALINLSDKFRQQEQEHASTSTITSTTNQDIARLRREIKTCLEQRMCTTPCGENPLVSVCILGRIVRVFGNWYTLCAYCGCLCRVNQSKRFDAEVCCLRCDFVLLHGKERAIEEERKRPKQKEIRCRYCNKLMPTGSYGKWQKIYAPLDDTKDNEHIPPPLRYLYYCPSHSRSWLAAAHKALPTPVVLCHILSRARPVYGASGNEELKRTEIDKTLQKRALKITGAKKRIQKQVNRKRTNMSRAMQGSW